jgi:hypothetical protein
MNRLIFAIALALASALPSTLLAQQFSFAPIDVPGATATQARGINASGEIVGFYKTTACADYSVSAPGCPTHGFKYVNGTYVKLTVPNATSTAIMGLNDFGDIVGFYTNRDGSRHGFLWLHTNVLKTIDYPGTSFVTVPMGVNNALTVVGGLWSINSNGTFAEGGFIWRNGHFSALNLGTAGCLNCTSVNGISNNGIKVGQAFRNDFWSAWLKVSSDLDPFLYQSSDSFGTAVNNNADVAGWNTANGGWFAKKIEANEGTGDANEQPPSFIAVTYPGAGVQTYPFGINLARAVVGSYFDSTEKQHGFMAKANF